MLFTNHTVLMVMKLQRDVHLKSVICHSWNRCTFDLTEMGPVVLTYVGLIIAQWYINTIMQKPQDKSLLNSHLCELSYAFRTRE